MSSNPNVLLLCVDDMNPWLGCLSDLPFSHPQAITPNLDRLTASGTVFTNTHSPAPLCNPARTAILTGLHPTTSGVYGNYCWWRPHLPDVKTLPERFRAQGYHAAGAGKVFHHCIGFNPPEQWDDYQDQVFDDTWDRQSRVNYPHITPGAPPPGHPLHGIDYFVHEFDWGSLPLNENDYGDRLAVDYATEFLSRSHDQPFFLACGLFHPHLPWYAPQRFFDLYDPDQLIIPEHFDQTDWSRIPEKGKQLAAKGPQDQDQYGVLKRAGKLKEALHAYLAMISFVDDMVGRVLDSLNNSEHADNTVVVFYGDHGFHVGQKNHIGKQTLWRESTQVPLIFSGPGIAADQRIDAPVSTLDVGATLADLCGWSDDANGDSQSLGPWLRREPTKRTAAVLCSLDEHNHALITPDWRYICYDDGSEELYDLRSDPLELNNLSLDPAMTSTLETLRSQLPAQPAPNAPGLEAYRFDWHNYRWESAS